MKTFSTGEGTLDGVTHACLASLGGADERVRPYKNPGAAAI